MPILVERTDREVGFARSEGDETVAEGAGLGGRIAVGWAEDWVGGGLSTLPARRSRRHTTEATRDGDLRAVKALDQAAFLPTDLIGGQAFDHAHRPVTTWAEPEDGCSGRHCLGWWRLDCQQRATQRKECTA